MITLGAQLRRAVHGAALVAAAQRRLYAVMAPGWRLLTFRALEFDHAEDLSAAC